MESVVIFEHLGSVTSQYCFWDITPCTRGDQTVDHDLPVDRGPFFVSVKIYLPPQYDQ